MSLTGVPKAENVLVGSINELKYIHGKSAYEIAVLKGFEGTEEEWLESLNGSDGKDGENYVLTEEDKEDISYLVDERISLFEDELKQIDNDVDNLFEQGKNLFNGVYEVGRANGDDSKTSESRSQWMKVTPGEEYTFSHSKSTSSFIIYGKTNAENSVQIHNGNIEKKYSFTIPDEITHIRFSAYNTVLNSNNIQFEMGSEATSYEAYRFVIKQELLPPNENTEIPEDILEQIENKQDKLVSGVSIKTINNQSLLGSGNINIDAVVNGDGSTVEIPNDVETTNNLFGPGKNLFNGIYEVGRANGDDTKTSESRSEWIAVESGEEYTFSHSKSASSFIIYGKNETENLTQIHSGNIDKKYTITIPDGITHIRFSAYNIVLRENNIQLEKGSEATSYEEYVLKFKCPDKSIDPEKTSFFGLKANGKNLLNRDVANIGFIVNSTGGLSTNVNVETSDFIPVTYGDNLFISGTLDGNNALLVAYAIFDENQKLLSAETSTSECKNPLVIPRNAKYVRYSYHKAGVKVQIERGMEATEYEAFDGVPCLKNEYLGFKPPRDYFYVNPWYEKKLVVDGDSITHDDGNYNYWQFVVRNTLEMVLPDYTGVNPDTDNPYPANGRLGIGGSRIANEGGNSTKDQSIVLRYMDLPDDADLVVIAGGTNDWAHNNVDLGDFDSTENSTFNGALNELLPALKAKYPTIPVVMMTPIKRGTVHNKTNSKGLTLEQFVDAMIAKCRQYGVYCLDMYANCPINPQIPVMKELLFNPNDDTHPNAEGHKIMGRTVAGFIRTLS